MKYYAVLVGRKTGIFKTWEETKNYVSGFPKAKYKSFRTLSEAKIFLQDKMENTKSEINTNKLIIYTDGSCVDKIGGFGYVYIYEGKIIGKSKGRYGKTNQVAELYAIYRALLNCPFDNIDLYTDSKYSIGCCTIWYKKWLTNGWKNSKGEPVANKELIMDILDILKDKNVEFHHVFGHTGNEYNEMCDKLANEGRLM